MQCNFFTISVTAGAWRHPLTARESSEVELQFSHRGLHVKQATGGGVLADVAAHL